MILKHFILNTSWTEVSESIVRIYPDQSNALEQFKKVYTQLHTMPVRQSGLCIHIEWDKDHPFEPLDSLKVYAMDRSETGSGVAHRYWIDYEPWGCWLGMAVDDDTHRLFSDADIVAACLWEMTFYGFCEASMFHAYEDLKQRNEKLDPMTQEEMAEHFTKIGEIRGYTVSIANDMIDKLFEK